ncbi:hypothetical protein IFM89_019588 [Coptis chinensis]|uniref:Uncharacterized protein n=1 Tax=Coptis chinensis TaxID=261450 RepID=A0A835IB65_9MAGN|nr:hypothetical protein IFM89_019588 [Coptis chinensis]
MPGTIQVSVLELVGLPSSSISVKISMGKREYQMWDNEEFSFPLTTVRDNLIVTLCDIEGNELSQTGVSTKLVMEKGSWDDIFPLEGGGRLHMKLQFILSEEERKRIRTMRESALKKKREELLINNKRYPEATAVATVVHNSAAGSLSLNHEVTDSNERVACMGAESITGRSIHGHTTSSPIIHCKDPESSPENRRAVHLENAKPKTADGREGTPTAVEPPEEEKFLGGTAKALQEHKTLHLSETPHQIVKDIYDQSPPTSIPRKAISSNGACEHSEIPSKNETDGTEVTPVLSQELNAVHHKEATQKIPEELDAQLPSIDVFTRCNSSQNETDGTEATPVPSGQLKALHLKEAKQKIPEELDTRSPPTDVATRPNSSQNQTHATIRQITLEKKSRINEADGKETSSAAKLSKELKVFHLAKVTRQVSEKADTQLTPKVVQTSFISSQNPSSTFLLGEKSSSDSSPFKENQTHTIENQTTMEKTPSNVTKMISAFESSLSQVPVPPASALKFKIPTNKTKTEVTMGGSSVNATKMEDTTAKKHQIKERELDLSALINPLDVTLQQRNDSNALTVEASDTVVITQNSTQFEVLDAIPAADGRNNSSKQVEFKIHNAKGALVEEFGGTSEDETATVSGRVLDDLFSTEHNENVHCEQQGSSINLESGCRAYGDNSESKRATSIEMRKSLKCLGVEEYQSEVMGSWTLPDEPSSLCITTGSKQMNDSVGSFNNSREGDQRESSLYVIGLEKEEPKDAETSVKVNNTKRDSPHLRKSNLEKLKDNIVSGGLLGQAVRIAIMVAFGTLVVVTRQRK